MKTARPVCGASPVVEAHPGPGRARAGHPRLSKEFPGHVLAHVGGVLHRVVEVDLAQSVKALPRRVLVKAQGEGGLFVQGQEAGGALQVQPGARVGPPVNGHIGLHPIPGFLSQRLATLGRHRQLHRPNRGRLEKSRSVLPASPGSGPSWGGGQTGGGQGGPGQHLAAAQYGLHAGLQARWLQIVHTEKASCETAQPAPAFSGEVQNGKQQILQGQPESGRIELEPSNQTANRTAL